jgi:hypothetical protein
VAFAAAGAGVRVPHANGRTIYHQGFATPAVALPAFDLVPPSRGAPCSTVRADGTVAPADRRWRCDATDGNRRWTLDPRIVSVTLELEAETEVADVFVPDCPEGCAVDVSADGATWSTLVESHPRDSATFRYSHLLIATSPVPQRARFVRLTRTEGLDGVTEGSVWPARPPPPPEPVPPTTLANGVPGEGAPPVPDDDGGGLLVPAAVAGLALGAAVIGASRASARRPV